MPKRKIVAIIPARGGSKRVPGKNVMDFCGKPMIAWTIEAAQASGLFDKIIVSTDDAEIARISIECGAEVPFLRQSKADDFSPVSEATIETLRQLEAEGEYFDDVIQLFAVCPLRTAEDIVASYEFYLNSKRPFMVSCFKYAWMNPWWAISLNKENEATWIFEDSKKRSQDLPELYCPTGAIWTADVKELYKENTFYGAGHVFWEIDWKRAVDIDNYEDIQLAKALYLMNEA
jgi:CMP-N-acetylneuraminic acid synthetase